MVTVTIVTFIACNSIFFFVDTNNDWPDLWTAKQKEDFKSKNSWLGYKNKKMGNLGRFLVLTASKTVHTEKNTVCVFVCLYVCGRNGHYTHTDVNTVVTLFVYASQVVWSVAV